MKFVLAAIAVI